MTYTKHSFYFDFGGIISEFIWEQPRQNYEMEHQ